MLIVNQIENTHFSKTEKEIVDYIIDQGMNIEKMSANEIEGIRLQALLCL